MGLTSKKRVAVVKCDSYDYKNVKNAVEKGISLVGGLDSFVVKGKKTLLKPNILAGDHPDKCTTTHPSVLKAVAELLIEKGVTVSYGDSPGFGDPLSTAKAAHFDEVARELNIKFADFVNAKEVSYKDGVLVKKFYIANAVIDADAIISLPKLKTHQFERITAAIKNQFGCIPGVRKAEYHVRFPDAYDFARFLFDLNNCIAPVLYVMDAVIAMEGNGPRGGTPKKLGAILVSTDPVAIDIIACKLIDLNPDFVPTIKEAKYILGELEYSNIEILGDNIEELIDKKFNVIRSPKERYDGKKNKSIISFIKNSLVRKPIINRNKCIKCGICVKACPANPKALSFKDKKKPPIYNYLICFRCYCCQEMCPESAITLKRPLLRKILFFLKD